MRTGWWRPPRDDVSRSLVRRGMPKALFGFLWRVSKWDQLRIAVLGTAVFVLHTAPLEMQRRILNAATLDRDFALVAALAAAYAAFVVAEGAIKLAMNVYGGWIGEKAVRVLRLAAGDQVDAMPHSTQSADVRGVEISMMLSEPEAIGGFVGVAISELVVQTGILLAVFGYMFFVHPLLATVCLAIFAPQLVFVPLMQRAINRRVQARIGVLRQVSAAVLRTATDEAEDGGRQKERFVEVFELNLGILKLKFSMKFLMNLTHNLGQVVVLCIGGWYVIRGETDVGTVVAFVSGLGNVRDPWGDLVNWYQDLMLTSAKYRTFAAAMRRFARREDPLAAA
jgi:ABC-type bacteriocin/lantibiotic exporter with double-glycine peptidase domain